MYGYRTLVLGARHHLLERHYKVLLLARVALLAREALLAFVLLLGSLTALFARGRDAATSRATSRAGSR